MFPYVHVMTEFLNNKTHFHFWKEEKTNAIKVNKLQFPFQPTRLSITSTPYTFHFLLLTSLLSSSTPTKLATPPVFFCVSLAANPRTSISPASQALKGSGWNVPSAANHLVNEVSISFSCSVLPCADLYWTRSLYNGECFCTEDRMTI